MITDKKNNDLLFPERPSRRHSFMLRCMESRGLDNIQNGNGGDWLFSLHDPQNDSVIDFRDLDALVLFLEEYLNMD